MDFTPDFELGGYAEVRASYQFGVEGVPWALTERVRPAFKVEPSQRVTAEAVVESALTEGRYLPQETVDLISASDLASYLEEGGCSYTVSPRYTTAADYLSVERLHVDFNLPSLDLVIGRQAVRWGSGLVFHPTDIYAEVLATEPWREPKGVNAVKATVPIGPHQVVGALVLDDDLSGIFPTDGEPFTGVPVSAAVRATANVLQSDLSAVSKVSSDGSWFAGWDVRGTTVVGWWDEGGYRSDTKSVENVVGVDYSLPVLQNLYFAAEYRFDGSGSDPLDYDWAARLGGGGSGSVNFDCPEGTDGGDSYITIDPDITAAGETEPRFTLGRHFVDGVVRLAVNNDVTLQSSVIFNLADGTGLVVPDFAFNVGPRVALHVGGQVPFGKDGEFKPESQDLTLRISGPGFASYADLSGLVPTATVQAWARYSF